ncbi:unnamed protein product, partial [Didymodactylos carnosus]
VNEVQQIFKPALYPKAIKQETNNITQNEIVEFLLDFISCDSVGILSNRHLACCALYNPQHKKALKLAKIISDSLDYPKTGINPVTTKVLKDLQFKAYPDYMQNQHKQVFQCQKALGWMFRNIKEVHNCHMQIQDDSSFKIQLDQDLFIEGFDKYLEQAKQTYREYCDKLNIILL